MQLENKTGYKLHKLEIEYVLYGDDKGKYKGKVKFQNEEWEQFSFNLDEAMTQKYIGLVSEEIVKSANQLGQDLINSLGLNKEDEKRV